MKRTLGLTALACLVGLTAATLAQSPSGAPEPVALDETTAGAPSMQQAGTISRVYFIRVKPGMEAQWMEAAKEHVAWHRAQNDTFTWLGFFVETGKNTGMYGWITQNHQWADFDAYDAKMGQADGEHAMATMGQFEESYTNNFTMSLPDVSNPPEPGAQFPLVNVTHYTIEPTKQAEVMGAIGTFHGAMQKGGFEGRYMWSMNVNGGEGMVLTIASPLAGWADMAEPDPTVEQILAAQLGEEGAQELFQTFFGAVVKSESWMARILPDLTYTPGG